MGETSTDDDDSDIELLEGDAADFLRPFLGGTLQAAVVRPPGHVMI